MKTKSLQIHSAKSSGDHITLDCESGIFWCVLNNASKGVWLSAKDLTDPHLETLVHDLGKEGQHKAIGSQELITLLTRFLAKKGITLEKGVERTGHYSIQFFPVDQKLRVSNEEIIPLKKQEKKIKVLIVDDSATIRTLLKKVFAEDPQMEVVGAADKPSVAREMMRKFKPDVITLDIHMPEMDGVTFLKEYLVNFPIPTVMISSISMEEGPAVLTALEIGAVDYVQKPSASEFQEAKQVILEKVRTAASVRIAKKQTSIIRTTSKGPIDLNTIIAVGSSTGGTEALRVMLTALPAEIPPMLIVQHIPPVFSKAFADRMNQLCPFEVREAVDGDEVMPGLVLVAPGGTQMSIRKRSGNRFFVQVDPTAGPVNRHKPSVDVLFDSVVKEVSGPTIGIILTGMGADGAKGLLNMKNKGARTIAQDEASCVVYGMPREAVKLGAADQILPLQNIPDAILKLLMQKAA